MTARARALRRAATADERVLWAHIRNITPRFTRQLPVGNYIVDFACRSLKIAVEIDGSQHLETLDYDNNRTEFLERLGWQVIRFWNSEIRENVYGVSEAILAAVAERRGPTRPQPLPSREGSIEDT